MYLKKHILPIVASLICIILLMLYPEVAVKGASIGIDQCIRIIIPSLFPYFFLCTYINTWLLGLPVPVVRFLAKILKIPKGGESILLLGLISGYPVGAQTISSAYQNGLLSRQCAHILLGYCNNAGPAFIFGVTSCLFKNSYIPWLLWLVQLLSILTTGFLLPRPTQAQIILKSSNGITIVSALRQSIGNIASVCGWIILFKVLISYLTIFQQDMPSTIFVLSHGFLELSNGSLELSGVNSEPLRFLLCSAFLSWGGICVLMQTQSAVNTLGLGYYIPGKLLQTSWSLLFSLAVIYLVFPEVSFSLPMIVSTILVSLSLIFIILLYFRKNYGNLLRDDI